MAPYPVVVTVTDVVEGVEQGDRSATIVEVAVATEQHDDGDEDHERGPADPEAYGGRASVESVGDGPRWSRLLLGRWWSPSAMLGRRRPKVGFLR